MKRTIRWLLVIFVLMTIPGLCPAQDTNNPVVIGWIMNSRGMGDGGFNDTVNALLTKISQERDIKVLRVPRLDLYADKTVSDLLSLGATIIIATDEGGMNGAISEAARTNPTVKFILVGAEGAPLTNLASIMFEENEAGYMAGYIAGTITAINKVGFVGGAVFDPVLRFDRGFSGGARDANKNVEVVSTYVSPKGDVAGLYNRDQTNEIVMKLAKQGTDVVFTVSGTGALGAIAAAEKMNTAIIGLGDNEEKRTPAAVASVIYRYDTAVKGVLTTAISGGVIGGIYIMDFANGGMDVAGLSPKLGADKTRKIMDRKKLLAAGKVSVPDYLTERKKEKLVVSLNIDMPPYEFLSKKGQPAGYVVDVMKEVGRRLGLAVSFNSFSGDRIPIGLAAMRSDIEPMVMIDEERTASFVTGDPWGIAESMLIVKKSKLVPKEIFELISKKVAVVSGSVEERYVQKLPGIFSVGMSSSEFVLMALAAGEVDAAVVNKDIAQYFLSDALEDEDLIMLDKPVIISPYAVAMPKPGDPAFIAMIDRVLNAMKTDGTLDRLTKKWFE